MMILFAVLFGFLSVIWFLRQYYSCMGKHKIPPGPIRLPIVGNLIQIATSSSLPAVAFDKLSRKHGDIMSLKIGQLDAIVLSSYEAIRDLMSYNELSSRSCEGLLLDRNMGENIGIIFSNGKLWENIRNFTVRNLRQFGLGKSSVMEALIQEEYQEFSHCLTAKIKAEFDNKKDCIVHVDGYFKVTTVNIIWNLMTGERFKYDDPQLIRLIQLNDQIFQSTNFASSTLIAFPILRLILPGLTGRTTLLNNYVEMHSFVKGVLQKYRGREGRKENPQNFLELFINKIENEAEDPVTYFTDIQLVYIVLDLLQAGGDTASQLMSYAVLYMLLNPRVQEKVQAEIDLVVQTGTYPTLDHKSRLVYTQATVLEVMRCGNVVPIAAARKATQEFVYKDFVFKKNIDVMANLVSVFMDEKFWGDPENFRPERFITSNGDLDSNKTERIIVFGLGKRNCLGETLAQATVFLFFSRLMQQFTFRKVDGQPDPRTEPRIGVTMSPYPFDVKVKIRN